jgi:hypothetical protein
MRQSQCTKHTLSCFIVVFKVGFKGRNQEDFGEEKLSFEFGSESEDHELTRHWLLKLKADSLISTPLLYESSSTWL